MNMKHSDSHKGVVCWQDGDGDASGDGGGHTSKVDKEMLDQDFMGSLPSGFFPCFSNSALKHKVDTPHTLLLYFLLY